MDPVTGECTELLIQAVHPAPKTNQIKITDKIGLVGKLCVCLFRSPPRSIAQVLLWPFKFIFCYIFLSILPILAFYAGILFVYFGGNPDELKLPSGGEAFTDKYPKYLMCYWGQMWAARSHMEYSKFDKLQDINPMSIPLGFKTTVPSVTPRKLVIYRNNVWEHCEDPDIIIKYRFIAISYSDVFERGTDEEGEKMGKEQEKTFIESVRATTLECGMQAYWLDLECWGKSTEETSTDIYCMADVYRGASFTLITIGKSDTDKHSIQSWKNWGGRLWALPEALLSRELRYRIGIDGPVLPITLHQLANKVYEKDSTVFSILNTHNGTDPLRRLERLTLLKSAIWCWSSAALPSVLATPPKDPEKYVPSTQSQCAGMENSFYPAEKVYALMGFYEHRIMPNRLETEPQALGRLLMVNNSDRMAERMVSMLPHNVQPTACWYADDDMYRSQIWNIEPEIQVAGVTENGALVLEGCCAATIQWKSFPEVDFQTANSWRRKIASYVPLVLPVWLFFTLLWLPQHGYTPVWTTFFGVSAILFVVNPIFIAYSISGRILHTQPWLIGVKGVLSSDEAADRIYGGTLSKRSRLSYTPSGSLFSRPSESEIREGLEIQYEEAKSKQRDDMYTLVDTCSGTVYYFTAKRPPTVCLFTGREGGLGRFVLCSENCTANELHKETVLRMPSYIHRAMTPCNWVAVG